MKCICPIAYTWGLLARRSVAPHAPRRSVDSSSFCFSFYFFFLPFFFLSLSLSPCLLLSLLPLCTLLVVSSAPSSPSLQTRRQSKLKARLVFEWGQDPEMVSISGRNNRDCAYQASIIPPSPDFNVGARATMHWGKKDS